MAALTVRELPSAFADHLEQTSWHSTDQSNKPAQMLPGQTGKPLTIAVAFSNKSRLPSEVYTPIPYIVPAQLFAASLAEVKNLDPDRPRTLSKVTATL